MRNFSEKKCFFTSSIVARVSRSTVVVARAPQLSFNDKIAGFETNTRSCLLKYGAPCHADVIVR